jgi:transposase
MDLTDQQWDVVRPYLPGPEQTRTTPKGGRPWRDPRDVLNGVLWVLRTGAPWADLPPRYPPAATCHRRFQTWVKTGALQRVLQRLADDLVKRGKLDLSETFIDGTHAGAKKGAVLWAELVADWPPNSWRSQTAVVFLYRRRWKIERLFAWLLRYRRISTRYEYNERNFLGFVHLGCLMLLLRHI